MNKRNLPLILLLLLALLIIFICVFVIYFLFGGFGILSIKPLIVNPQNLTLQKDLSYVYLIDGENSNDYINTPINQIGDEYTECLINPNLDYCMIISGDDDKECTKASDCGDDYDSDKYCEDGDVYIDSFEYSCESNKCVKEKTSEKVEDCANGCSNGSCSSNTCNFDNDCSNGEFCEFNNGICNAPGICVIKPQVCTNEYNPVCGCNEITYSNDCFRRMAKISKSHDGECDVIVCSNDSQCDDGNAYTQDTCLNPGTPQSYCNNVPIECLNNEECGTDGFTGNPFCTGNDVFQNFLIYTCNNPGTIQSSCSISASQVLNKICEVNQICSNGECIPVECYDDGDCDDADTHTQDTCLNPGTPQSYCNNVPIECLNNLDCGTNGFVNGLFCTGNDVFQNFITYTCNNPGTVNSSCSNSTNAQLKENCNTCGKFSDSFDFFDSSKWNQLNTNNPSVIENERLKCIGSPGDIDSSRSGVTSKFKLHGDFDIQINYDGTELPVSDSSASIGLAVLGEGRWSERGETYGIGTHRNSDGSYSVGAWTSQGIWPPGKTWLNGATIIHAANGAFRLQRIGTTMYGYQMQNGNWVNIATILDCDTTDMTIFLNVYDNLAVGFSGYNPKTPIGYFDNFVVNNNGCNGNNINQQCSNGQCASNTCGRTGLSPSVTASGIKFTSISQSVDSSATNTLQVSVKNLDSFSKTITYKKYSCRCQEHLGDSSIKGCYVFWPFESYCESVDETLTLGPNETKNIEVSATQYQNMKCGSFQLDVSLTSVNGSPVNNLGAWSFADLCNDCSN